MEYSKKASAVVLSDEEKLNVFKRGMVISLNHPAIFEPVLNVIQKVEGDNLYFRLPEIFLKNNVLKGDEISYQILLGEYEYVVEGIISEIDIHYPRLVQATVDKVYKFANYRQTRRYLASFQANIQTAGSDKKIYAIVKNVSLTGVGLVLKEQLDTETIVNITVSTYISKNEVLEFKANILRLVPKSFYNEYGMEITQIDEKNKDLLDRLIFQLQENESTFVADCLK
ncbi:MAG: PilZ domain-containing protein [Clostridia bacterium]|nr:PilZ domain-containing protein [Clostridia bacterium]